MSYLYEALRCLCLRLSQSEFVWFNDQRATLYAWDGWQTVDIFHLTQLGIIPAGVLRLDREAGIEQAAATIQHHAGLPRTACILSGAPTNRRQG